MAQIVNPRIPFGCINFYALENFAYCASTHGRWQRAPLPPEAGYATSNADVECKSFAHSGMDPLTLPNLRSAPPLVPDE